jgi:putative ABC transport system substrate-binding protein
VKRRAFITLLGGAAAWPVAARAQQTAAPVIGFLYAGAPEPIAHLMAAFRRGLSDLGYVEGRNVTIEFRWGRNDDSLMPQFAADLVRRNVNVLVTPGSLTAPLAAKAATSAIPIVFSMGGDPIQVGLVTSFNRPGGNVTGISSMNTELGAKRLGLLAELLPQARRFAALVYAGSRIGRQAEDLTEAAATSGHSIEIYHVADGREIAAAFDAIAKQGLDAVVLTPGPLFNNNRMLLAALAARRGIAAIYSSREFVEVGGLMSYGPSIPEEFRQVGIYTARILKGERDLPVMRSSHFELIINLPVAKALGIDVPPTLLARANEVIE